MYVEIKAFQYCDALINTRKMTKDHYLCRFRIFNKKGCKKMMNVKKS